MLVSLITLHIYVSGSMVVQFCKTLHLTCHRAKLNLLKQICYHTKLFQFVENVNYKTFCSKTLYVNIFYGVNICFMMILWGKGHLGYFLNNSITQIWTKYTLLTFHTNNCKLIQWTIFHFSFSKVKFCFSNWHFEGCLVKTITSLFHILLQSHLVKFE